MLDKYKFWQRGMLVRDEALCDNCGVCIEKCPHLALGRDKNGQWKIRFICMRCGYCLKLCEKGALRIASEIVNITAGEELTKILSKKYPNQFFTPFNEAMIKQSPADLSASVPLFSDEFIRVRARVHGVTEASYRENMRGFLTFLAHLGECKTVVLWFGDEDFCRANRETVLATLQQRGFKGEVRLNIVDELTGEILYKK